MHTQGDPVKQNKGKFASQTCVTSGLSNGVPSEHLRKHGSVLCRISVAYSAAMQDRKPELCPHVSGHIAMHLASHLQIYHRKIIWVVFGGHKALQHLKDSSRSVHVENLGPDPEPLKGHILPIPDYR